MANVTSKWTIQRRKECYENVNDIKKKDTFEKVFEKIFKRKLGEGKI
jgi:hypothetical protein